MDLIWIWDARKWLVPGWETMFSQCVDCVKDLDLEVLDVLLLLGQPLLLLLLGGRLVLTQFLPHRCSSYYTMPWPCHH